MNISNDTILAAFRYALGRQTYIVSSVVEDILKNWDNIDNNLKNLIKKEIEEAIEQNRAGMECDIKEWKKILNY